MDFFAADIVHAALKLSCRDVDASQGPERPANNLTFEHLSGPMTIHHAIDSFKTLIIRGLHTTSSKLVRAEK